MISYKKNGHDYILMANSDRGVIKLDAANLEQYKAITAPTDIAGVPYQTMTDWKNVAQLEKVDDTTAVILSGTGSNMDLRTLALP
jgi:hypothetical protein